jgi:DNA-binding transcriptional MerR regulator
VLGRYYTTGQFARRAGVSVRTLRYYDQVGLLSPSGHTEAGYRLYSDDDLPALQQILALKFLDFSLEEIQACRAAESRHLSDVLRQQRAMLRERRAQIETILRAIEQTEHLLDRGKPVGEALVQVMEVIQMQQKNDWVDQYFTPEQRQKLEELSKSSYSEEARQALAARQPAWTEADQKRVDARWGWVNAELKRLIAAGASPASPEAQAWAKERFALLHEFTQGNPEIQAGLQKFWQSYQALPQSEQNLTMPVMSPEEIKFTQEAMRINKSAS